MSTVLNQLKNIVNQIDDNGCSCFPCPQVAPPSFPYLQVCMLDPPCAVVPFEPRYVKPLQMPSPPLQECENEAEGLRNRTLNFYNNYNIDYHLTGNEFKCKKIPKRNMPRYAATVGGKFPNSPCSGEECIDEGCPTGFKPCKMKLCPPFGCHPLGTWYASVQPCSPKVKRRGICSKNKQ